MTGHGHAYCRLLDCMKRISVSCKHPGVTKARNYSETNINTTDVAEGYTVHIWSGHSLTVTVSGPHIQ